jgi:predicted nucleic acid-binding protein
MQQACMDLFGSMRAVLTTSNVIGEIQGLQKLTGDDLRTFWLYSMQLLASKGLDEKLLRLIEDMFHREDVRNNVTQIGPTDAGLIELARREGCVLLTDDERTLGPVRLAVSGRLPDL